MIYRVSLIINAILSLLFILLVTIGTLSVPKVEPTTIVILGFIFFAYSIFLLFDLVCKRVRTLNREKQHLPGWIKNHGRVIFGFTILALLIVLFMNLASTYAFIKYLNEYSLKQRSFYIVFLFLLMISAVSTIVNVVGYLKAIKENKNILSNYIEDIGLSS